MNYPVNENQRTIGNTSFADMIAQAQVVTDIDNSIAALTVSLAALGASSSAEINRATAKENSISAFVTAEASRAGAAETGIKASVVAEIVRAKAAEIVLTAAVTALQTAPSVVAYIQDITYNSFWCNAFGGLSSNSDGSINQVAGTLAASIRVYRTNSVVTLQLFSCYGTSSQHRQTAIFAQRLDSWARPSSTVSCSLNISTGGAIVGGTVTISPNGSVIMNPLSNTWGTYGGIQDNSCISYLV